MNNALGILTIFYDVKKEDEGLFHGILTCSVVFGCFIGSVIGISIVKLKSRVGLFAIDISIILGGTMLFYGNIYLFILGRVIMGIGCGLAPSITAIYMKQICPK